MSGEAPRDLRSSFPAAASAGALDPELAERLAPSAGLRNVLVHAYIDLDPALLVGAVPFAAEQYAEYVRQVARWVGEQEAGGRDR